MLPTLTKGKPLSMAAVAASAVVPAPPGPSSSTDSSEVLSLCCTCVVQAAYKEGSISHQCVWGTVLVRARARVCVCV
jgi:hypothetical protein